MLQTTLSLTGRLHCLNRQWTMDHQITADPIWSVGYGKLFPLECNRTYSLSVVAVEEIFK